MGHRSVCDGQQHTELNILYQKLFQDYRNRCLNVPPRSEDKIQAVNINSIYKPPEEHKQEEDDFIVELGNLIDEDCGVFTENDYFDQDELSSMLSSITMTTFHDFTKFWPNI